MFIAVPLIKPLYKKVIGVVTAGAFSASSTFQPEVYLNGTIFKRMNLQGEVEQNVIKISMKRQEIKLSCKNA